ncbi:uncharacterized protein LOC135575376 isoform X2 [Columba livia]|uniref:uncharacterized protein LOC135575376 isoform X2 n=1 Tax=Columba livia TaxID=8932 RepID=UPI0031B9FE09
MGDPSGSRWPAVARQQQKRIEGTGRWRMPKPPGSAVGAALREARGACPCFLFPLLKRSCRVSVRCGEVLQDAALRNRLLWGCSCGQLLVSVVPALRRGVEPAPGGAVTAPCSADPPARVGGAAPERETRLRPPSPACRGAAAGLWDVAAAVRGAAPPCLGALSSPMCC